VHEKESTSTSKNATRTDDIIDARSIKQETTEEERPSASNTATRTVPSDDAPHARSIQSETVEEARSSENNSNSLINGKKSAAENPSPKVNNDIEEGQ